MTKLCTSTVWKANRCNGAAAFCISNRIDSTQLNSLTHSLLLPPAQTQRLAYATEAQSAEQLVDAQAAEQAVDDAAETEAVEQLADQAEHAGEQEADGRDDLEQRLREQAPERVELLLGVGHVVELLLRVLNRLHNGGCELFERVGQGVLLGRGFAGGGSRLRRGCDVAVWVESADGAVAFLQDAVAFFDHGLDVFDELFFVELLLWCSVRFVHTL